MMRHHCRHTMLFGRHCSKTSAGIWHRAQPSQRPEAHEGGALASEAVDMWDNPCFSLPILFRGALPQVKKQHLTAPNKRRRLEWCTSMSQRLGETKRPHSGCCSCKTHISRSFHATFLLVLSHSADDLHAVLCRTVSRISFTVSRFWEESYFLPRVTALFIFHDVIFIVLSSFLVFLVGFQCFWCIHRRSTRLNFSLSLPRIWLSRSASKIDAPDDDETPLRLTASQTATTRGVMVSGIMGALDIAPTIHVVEPGLENQR